jgi:hypothetical protein
MSATDNINQAQFHWINYGSTKRMYPQHTPRSDVRKVSHTGVRGHKGNVWQHKAAHGK